MIDITATHVKKPIGGTVPLEVASAFLNHVSDAELNHIWIDGMLGDLNCWASFYLPDQSLMVERPRFIKLSIEEGFK